MEPPEQFDHVVETLDERVGSRWWPATSSVMSVPTAGSSPSTSGAMPSAAARARGLGLVRSVDAEQLGAFAGDTDDVSPHPSTAT